MLIVNYNLKNGFLGGCVIFATIIGAGFASGKEVWYYFARYGVVCYPVIIFVGILFFILCFLCLQFGKKFEITAVKQLNYIMFKKFSFIAEVILCFSNFIILSTMFAGANSLFYESFGLTFYRIGGVFTAIISILVVWLGFKRLLKINMVIVPGMLVVVLVVLFNCVVNNSFQVFDINIKYNALFSVINSISFIVSNLFFAGFIFAKMGNGATTKTNIISSIVGSVFMVLCILCMVTILYYNPSSFAYDMPLVYIAGQQNIVLGIIARVVVWLGIATTAISLLYQINNWLESYFGKNKIIGIVVCIVALLFAHIGFSAMINYFYPLLGFLGFLFLIFMSRQMSNPPKHIKIGKV